MGSAHSKSHVFLIKIQSNAYAFFWYLIQDAIFEICVRLDAKIIDFGNPLAPNWAPNGAQNRSSGDKKHVDLVSGVHPWASLLPNRFSERSLAQF